MATKRTAFADITNKRSVVLSKLKRMRPSGPPKKYLEKKKSKKAAAVESAEQLERRQDELQDLGPEMRTPESLPHESDAQQRSPSVCLRRREKKSRSRTALLENLNESESQILQRLDFTGCSDNELDADDAHDENAPSSSNAEPAETTPPVTLKRKLPQSSELSAAAKRKKLQPRAPKKNLKAKKTATEAVDAAISHMKLTRSGEQPKVPIRNTCVLNSPGDEQDRKAKRSKSRKNKAIDKHPDVADAIEAQAPKKKTCTLIASRLCSLQRMFGGD